MRKLLSKVCRQQNLGLEYLEEPDRKRQRLAPIETLCKQAKFKQIVSDLDTALIKQEFRKANVRASEER